MKQPAERKQLVKKDRPSVSRTGESRVHANGVEVVYDTFGEGSDPALLLIMGLSTQMIVWEDEFCERLAGRGFFVVRFDNRDAGRSSNFDPPGMQGRRSVFRGSQTGIAYTLDDMAGDTLGLMDALGVASAHIVGASMGGMIAQILALNNPRRVQTLTLIMSSSGNPFLPAPRPEALRVLFKPFPTRREPYIEYFLDTWRVLNGREIPVDRQRMRRLAERSFERGVSPEGSARQLAAIFAAGNRKSSLAALEVPTLVVHGDADPLLPVECGIDLAESIPGSRLKIIKGMGHWLPPAVWKEVIEAMDRHIRCRR
jgi:pimeloyl-ACP methyl ester carboxylesterase